MITVVTYLWGEKYGVEHVARLRRGVARHLKQPHRFAVISDDGRAVDDCEAWHIPGIDLKLTKIPGCLARLRLFDPDYLSIHGAEKVVVLDLDSVITGDLDPLFNRPEPFAIFQGANSANPCPYNGSTWMLEAGYRPDVWFDFSVRAAGKVPYYKFPEDQAWLAHKIPNAPGWKAGSHGMYAFRKPGWPKGDGLPRDARIVTFVAGEPADYTHLEWVRNHWLA